MNFLNVKNCELLEIVKMNNKFLNNKEIDKQFIANTYARFDIEIVSGKGSLLVDSNGKEYIDLATGEAETRVVNKNK